MNQPNRLRWTLIVQGIYHTVLGLLFIFFPSVVEAVFSVSLPDAALTPLYGTFLLTIALAAYLVVQDIEKYARLVWVFIFEWISHILVFLYLLVSGIVTLSQAGPPLIISVIFLVLLLVFRR